MGKIRTERIYGSAADGGAFRILVDRLWPRGISREKAAINEWWKEVAPSAVLRGWFHHDPAKYEEFRERYWAELSQNSYAADCRERIGLILKRQDVVLLFAAKDSGRNNAVVLKEWLAIDDIDDR